VDSDERLYLGKHRPKIRASSLDVEEKDEIDPVTELVNSGSHLDLGLEPLRRIVDEIHRLSTDTAHYTFDPKAARAAGLLRYGEYLQGRTSVSSSSAVAETLSRKSAAQNHRNKTISSNAKNRKNLSRKTVSWVQ